MNVHEYQAKAILKAFGAPVAGGAPASTPDEAEKAARELGGPVWVVKAQIHAGGRGKGRFKEQDAGEKGGVRLARSVGEVRRLAEQMLGRTLVTHQTGPNGKRVNRVYVEQGSDITREFYLSLLVDRASSRVAFVVSTEGGVNIEEVAAETPEKIVTFSVDPATGLCPHHVRRLSQALGLGKDQQRQMAKLATSLYDAFLAKDMSLLEINPLILTTDGRLFCLDAKMGFDANALDRHADVAALRDETEENEKEIEASKFDLSYIALDGTIGCMVNGAGLAMATMDIIKQAGGEPANFLDVGGGASPEQIENAFRILSSDPNVKAVFINVFGGILRVDRLAEGVIAAVRKLGLTLPVVLRAEGTNVEQGKAMLAQSGLALTMADDMADGARKAVALARGRPA
jgi:succinyl-CoA synthetase beta subunit